MPNIESSSQSTSVHEKSDTQETGEEGKGEIPFLDMHP